MNSKSIVLGERGIMQISKVEVKVSLWGVGAAIFRKLLWMLIAINLSNLALLTWTTLTPNLIMAYTVPAMLGMIVGVVLYESADRAACR